MKPFTPFKKVMQAVLLTTTCSLTLFSCKKDAASDAQTQLMTASPVSVINPLPISSLDIQAHRGGRGLRPENTLASMKYALTLPIKTLEMDVMMSKDLKVIVSHDPYLNPAFTTLRSTGKVIPVQPKKYFYTLNYADIKNTYDVGTKQNPSFPRQKTESSFIPLLSDIIDAAESNARSTGRALPYYNIETKTEGAAGDNIYHPAPKVFVKLLMDVLKSKNITSRVMIQSFDVRTLKELHTSYPTIKTAHLVSSGTLSANVTKLGFAPTVYSPNYTIVTQAVVVDCHNRNIRIIPWTVNTQAAVNTQIALGVDGIISDYPDLNFTGKQVSVW